MKENDSIIKRYNRANFKYRKKYNETRAVKVIYVGYRDFDDLTSEIGGLCRAFDILILKNKEKKYGFSFEF